MGEVELVEAGNHAQFSAGQTDQPDYTQFMSTNRTGRRNAVSYLSDEQMTMNCGHHEDLSVTCLAQKLQQMDTGAFSNQPSTSGYSTFGGNSNYTCEGTSQSNTVQR